MSPDLTAWAVEALQLCPQGTCRYSVAGNRTASTPRWHLHSFANCSDFVGNVFFIAIHLHILIQFAWHLPTMSSSESAIKLAETIGDTEVSPVRVDPSEDGARLQLSFTVPSDAFKDSGLIRDVLKHSEAPGNAFSIDSPTSNVLAWVISKLQSWLATPHSRAGEYYHEEGLLLVRLPLESSRFVTNAASAGDKAQTAAIS